MAMRGKNLRRTNGTKRDAVRATVLRQESLCHLCGTWVDKRLPPTLPGSPEIDELLPVTHGGSPYDRRNCRLAHRYCNRLRWSGPVEEARALLMANPPSFDAAGNRVATPLRAVTSRAW